MTIEEKAKMLLQGKSCENCEHYKIKSYDISFTCDNSGICEKWEEFDIAKLLSTTLKGETKALKNLGIIK